MSNTSILSTTTLLPTKFNHYPMPQQIILAYGLLAVLISIVHAIGRKAIISRIASSLFLVGQLGLTLAVIRFAGATPFGFFTFDSFAIIFLSVGTLIAVAAFCHSRRYIVEEEGRQDSLVRAQYFAALTALTAAVSFAVLSADMAVTWIFVEVTTLSASALIFYRRTPGAVEATWKYVFACSISLVLVYVGILFASLSMGSAESEGVSYAALTTLLASLDPFWLKMAFIFVFVGYTAKMSLVPMFTAGIDAKDKAPTPAAAMLSSVVMNAGFAGFYRFYAIVSHTSIAHWASSITLFTGLLSVFIAAVYLVRVNNVKRLFAYSSVEHMGIVMIGLAAGGVGVYAAILHLVLHSLAKSAVFFHISNFYRVFGSKHISHMGQYIERTPVGGAFLILALLCITAMPPSGLFLTEFIVFKSLADTSSWLSLALLMIVLCVIVWAISRDVLAILFLAPKHTASHKAVIETNPPVIETFWQFTLLLLSIWLGLFTPDWLQKLILEATSLVLQ